MVQNVFRGNLWSESKQKCCVLSAITWVGMFRYMLFSYMHASVVIVVHLLSHAWPSVTLWTVAYQTPLSFIVSSSLPKLMSVESVMPASHLVLSLCLLLCPQSFPASGSFLVKLFFAPGGQSIGTPASASVLPVNIQGWFPLELTDLILPSRGLSRVFSSTTIWRRQL